MPYAGRIRTSKAIQKQAQELRKEMTRAEKILWEKLRNRQLRGFKFRRQAPIGPFILDFYCPACRLVVEVDGSIHELQAEQDQIRTEQLRTFGYNLIRFTNQEIDQHLEAVLAKIILACEASSSAAPLPPVSGEGVGG